jgi:uncharacterized 2Fe-2S/4Fe-4S cluster protein (DUF4445 family)
LEGASFSREPESVVGLLHADLDEKAVALQRTGRLGTYASSLGQEAIGVGVAGAMRADDVLLPSFRDQSAMLWRGVTMTELLLGIDPEPVGVAPFITVSHDYPYMPASELGLRLHPSGRATVFPSLGAYVGGDIVAGLLATGMTRDRRLRLFIDVGTNCEIALGSAERLLCTAAPAGPAFEAAQIRCGMRAADGAIEVVRIKDDAIELQVIGDTAPVGMCGSGLVDAVAELVGAGLLDLSGRFVTNERAAEIAPTLARRLVAQIGRAHV